MLFFDRLRRYAIEHDLNQIYRRRLAARGTRPEGVFWNSKPNQINRFATLAELIGTASGSAALSIAEIGCGYGALFAYLSERPHYASWRYQGIDINPKMIDACKTGFPNAPSQFYVGRKPQTAVDFCVFSGTFNLSPITNPVVWERYVFDGLQACWQMSRRGMALNFLCAPQSKVTNQIYYVNQTQFIARAKAEFGPVRAMPTRHVKGDASFLILRE